MTLCTIIYDDVNGNDLNSGSNSPTTAITDLTTSQTIAVATSTLLTFSAPVNLSGILDDGSDVILVGTTAGNKHLFRIVSYTGTLSAVIDITVGEAATNTATGLTWAIGGKRKTLDADTSLPDVADAGEAFGYSLEANGSAPHYTIQDASCPMIIPALCTIDTGPVEIEAASDQVTIAFTSTTTWLLSNPAGSSAQSHISFRKITFNHTVGTHFDNHIWKTVGSNSSVQFIDCNFTSYGRCINLASGCHPLIHNCDISSISEQGVYASNQRIFVHMRNCDVHDCGAQGIRLQWGSTLVGSYFTGNKIRNNAEQGILWDNDTGFCAAVIDKNIFYGNGGAGIEFENAMNLAACHVVIINNIFEANVGTAILASNASFNIFRRFFDYNAFYNNGAEIGGWTRSSKEGEGAHDITLTASPFLNAAGNNFALNLATGGGELCRNAGYGKQT